MKAQEQRKLVTVWNEIEEVATDFRDMSNTDLLDCKECIKKRLSLALRILDDMIEEKYFQEVIN